MDTSLRPRMAATMPACRAVVAVRRHEPEREAAMLRALRVLHFSGWLLDDPDGLWALEPVAV
jgi:protein-disulfide isomerase-like protein with CxxC motif